VTKQSLALTSLIAAIPGLFLALLMVWAFIGYAGGSTVTLKLLAFVLLLIGGGIAALPVHIWLRGGPDAPGAKKKDERQSPAEPAVNTSETITLGTMDEVPAFSSSDFGTAEVNADFRPSDEFVETVAQPAVEEAEEIDMGGDFDFDSDEGEAPKGKK
jgi:hypothetical protein